MDTVMGQHYQAIFSGTRDEVMAYLQENPPSDTELVRYADGRVVYATEYMVDEPA